MPLDRKLAGLHCITFAGLRAPNRDGVFARHDDTIPFRIYLAQGTGIDGQVDMSGFIRIQMNAFERGQFAQRCFESLGLREIHFDHFVACDGAGVLHIHLDRSRITSLQTRRQFEAAVRKFRIAKAKTKPIERLA